MLHELRYILIPTTALITAQIIKFTIESIKEKKLKWARLFNGCGGMPSSHTTFAFSITTAVLIGEGYQSALFGVSLIFALIVAYDAMGLRKESGKQASMINRLMDEIVEKDTKQGFKKLKEQLGHNPSEVVAGILYGSLYAWLFMNIL